MAAEPTLDLRADRAGGGGGWVGGDHARFPFAFRPQNPHNESETLRNCAHYTQRLIMHILLPYTARVCSLP
jgi:hypothetical protein